MATTPEGRVKAKIKDFLKARPNIWWYMPVSNGMGTMGVPDFVGCWRGHFFAIEAKAPGKASQTTPLQKQQIKGIEHAHGWVCVADDVSVVQAMFDRMALVQPQFA